MTNKKIAIVEDEVDIAELIKHSIEKEGFAGVVFGTGELFFDWLKSNDPPMAVVLDLMLPGGMDGIEICKMIRRDPEIYSIPIIMLTAKDSEVDKVLGLEFGADDYMTKPFSPRELVARIKAVTRRAAVVSVDEEGASVVRVGDIILDESKYMVTVKGIEIVLTTTEFKVLKILMLKPGRVFSREKIIDKLWGEDKYITDRTVDVHITQIRKKIGIYAKSIKSVRGVGYKFEE